MSQKTKKFVKSISSFNLTIFFFQVFTFTPAPTQLHVFDTVLNMKGLCALSPTSDKALLAFPVSGEVSAVQNANISSSGLGRVQIVDLANPDNQPITIVAHDTKLSCLQMNIQGTRLATASDKGTLIRIFDTENGKLLSELRRGTQAATIYSINFRYFFRPIFSREIDVSTNQIVQNTRVFPSFFHFYFFRYFSREIEFFPIFFPILIFLHFLVKWVK